MVYCLYCAERVKQSGKIYCSNKCQGEYQHLVFIEAWLSGIADGGTGINAKSVSGHVRRYLTSKYSKGCAICGWKVINPITGRIPLEIDHIDGNSENNNESNLRMLCPNCHSLTPHFRNLNKGNGRSWRRLKYVKVSR
jgi:5-methylcytosine-specific restriction endonuclease McrA